MTIEEAIYQKNFRKWLSRWKSYRPHFDHIEEPKLQDDRNHGLDFSAEWKNQNWLKNFRQSNGRQK